MAFGKAKIVKLVAAILIVAILIGGVVASIPARLSTKSGGKGGQWTCLPNQLPYCVRQNTPTPDGFATEEECLLKCVYKPPQDLYWVCSGQAGNPPYTCVTTKDKSPWPVWQPGSKTQCEAKCFPPAAYFQCDTYQDTPVNTGACSAATTRGQGTFTCPPGVTTCADGKACPQSTVCKQKQCWTCNSSGTACEQIACENCPSGECFVTDPADPSTYGEFAKCQQACGTYVHCDTPGSCSSKVTAKPPSGWTKLPAGQSASDWCKANCAEPPPPPPPPPKPGHGWTWDAKQDTCTYVEAPAGSPIHPAGSCDQTGGKCPTQTADPLYYANQSDCLCCQCKNFSAWCPGATQCSPKDLPNPLCCDGSYCDASKCQTCTDGKCADKCADVPCGTCMGGGVCSNVFCTALFQKQCVCDKDNKNCKCTKVANCEFPLTWDNGSASTFAKWYCPNGGWCMDPKDHTLSKTFANSADPTQQPGICADGSACIKVVGFDPPPNGSAGCWPLADGVPIAQLPPI